MTHKNRNTNARGLKNQKTQNQRTKKIINENTETVPAFSVDLWFFGLFGLRLGI